MFVKEFVEELKEIGPNPIVNGEAEEKLQGFDLQINHNLCTSCNICVVSCPVDFTHLKKDGELTE